MLNLLSKPFLVAVISLFSTATSVFANGEDVHEEVQEVVTHTLEDSIRTNSIKIVVIASIIIILFVILTVLFKNASEGVKKFLFVGIVIPTLAATIFMVGSTLYLNFTSSSGGPVHWHADFEVWDCGQKLDLADPEGFSNKVGTATFHEHNDNRLHVEGVVNKTEEASLGRFFQFIGGNITDDEIRVPTNEGLVVRHDGDRCPDGTAGILQAFVYKTKNNIFSQQKLTDSASYILSPEANVPPGDCIIVEFDSLAKEKTDKLCDSYKLRQQLGEIKAAPGETVPEEETNDLEIPESTSSSETNHQHEEGEEPHGD